MGMVQAGNVQPPSRAARARRWSGEKIRAARPRFRIRPSPLRTTGMMSASQASWRMSAAEAGPV